MNADDGDADGDDLDDDDDDCCADNALGSGHTRI